MPPHHSLKLPTWSLKLQARESTRSKRKNALFFHRLRWTTQASRSRTAEQLRPLPGESANAVWIGPWLQNLFLEAVPFTCKMKWCQQKLSMRLVSSHELDLVPI